VIPLFLGLTIFNLLSLLATAGLGYGVMLRGATFAPYHQLLGVLSTIACCAVHCIVFTYFIATAKWVQHAIEVKQLDPALGHPTRSFKAHAFPAALSAMLIVFLAAVAGVITLGYGIRPIWHHLLATASVLINAGAAVIEYRAIVKNGRLIDGILERVNGTSGNTEATLVR
jgi:hypothetical protein